MTSFVVPEFLPEEFLERLRTKGRVVYDPDLYADRRRLLSELTGAAAILIRNRTRVDRELLEAASDMTVIGRLGVGLDNIDMDACAAAGVEVIPAVGANAVSVAEYVIGAMLVLIRGVYGMTSSMVEGLWPRQGHAFGHEVMGKTLGLVGFGSIAREVASRARGLEMEIAAHDPFVPSDDPVWSTARRVSLDRLLETAHVVSIHIPLSEQTRGLIGSDQLARMRAGAILINTARGGIVDEAALARALTSGHLGGAALDVFAAEPLGPGPASTFAGIDNLILTPHVAGNTQESVDRVARMTVDAVLARLGLEDG